MSRKCEMCASMKTRSSAGEHGTKANKLHRILIEDRIVVLCDGHAKKVHALGLGTIEELRSMFREKSGKRSLISRRAPVDRRIFPARPEGRRASAGRRASDRV